MAFLDKISYVLSSDITKDFRLKKQSNINLNESQAFLDILKKRRSIYKLGKKLNYTQSQLTELIQESVRTCPSALHSQSTRVVILYANSHLKFWQLVSQIQRQQVPSHIFEGVSVKIDQCANSYGTVLFYEDANIIGQLQKKKPFDAKEYPLWAEQTSGMAQLAVWTTLADAGIGASLQHYNPLIDEAISQAFNIPKNWILKSQLVFGSIEQKIQEKDLINLEQQFKVFS